MTSLIVTVTPAAGFISQDTAICLESASASASLGRITNQREAEAATFVGAGKAPKYELAGYATKIAALPHILSAVGMSGSYPMALSWHGALLGVPPARSIEDLNDITPGSLRTLRDRLGDRGTILSCQLGYSSLQGRVIGWAYSSEHDFEPMSLTGPHTFSPPFNPSDEGFDRLLEAHKAADQGREVAHFHQLVAQNHHRAFAAGMFREGVAIGGHLTTARIDQHGVAIRRAMEFPPLPVPHV